MTLTIHRGTHEIGGSCVEICSDKTKILIDLGMPPRLRQAYRRGADTTKI